MTNYEEPDDGLSIPDFLDRRGGRSWNEIHRALNSVAQRQRKWIMPKKSVKTIKRELKADHDAAVFDALPGTLGAISSRARVAKNLTKSSLNRLIKTRRVARLTKRTYGVAT
jgi:predicted nucleotidyltransferase|tara:strand:+ start:1153 stop:1488 length:336 start_codon:yes stop_codon:yes gene_type:complete